MKIIQHIKNPTISESLRLGILTDSEISIYQKVGETLIILKENISDSEKIDVLDSVVKELMHEIKNYDGKHSNYFNRQIEIIRTEDKFLRGYKSGPRFI